jgi:hypothetical protein
VKVRRTAALALLALISQSGIAFACSCIGPDPEKWLAEASLVFRGTAIGARGVTSHGVQDGQNVVVESQEVSFRIIERFKGPVTDTYTVLDGSCSVPDPKPAMRELEFTCLNTCAASFEQHHQYVVFAFLDERGRDSTSRCSAYEVGHHWAARYSLKQLRKEQKRRAKPS